MYKTRLSVTSLFILLFFKAIVHAATLTPMPELPAASPRSATELQGSPKFKTSTNPGWVSKCVGESRNGPAECSMEETLVLENTGESVAFIVVRTQSDTREPVMTIRVPVGLYLPAGLNIQIDDTKPQPVPLQTCNLQGCYAEMQISSTLLAALKGGKRLSIICQSLAKNKIMLPLALDNFADAFQKIQ